MSSIKHDEIIPEYTKQSTLIGLSIIIICSIVIIIQILTVITFLVNRLHTKNTAFKLIFMINIVTFFEQIGHFVSAFYIIFHIESDNIHGNIVGSFLQSSYMASVYLITLLTINRFDVIYFSIILPKLNKILFYKVLFIIFYIYYIANFIFCCIPSNRLFFNLNLFTWNFYKEKPGKSLGYIIESNCNFVLLIVSCVLYMAIIGRIFYLRTLTTSGNILKLEDVKLFLQAFFNYFAILILEICWGNWSYFTHNQIETTIIVNYLFIFICGSNTILGVIIISEIKSGIKKLLCQKIKILKKPTTIYPLYNNLTTIKV